MGYHEQHCQICGISFNIGRIRRQGEPESAAWQYYHDDFITLGDVEDDPLDEGCSNVPRVPGTTDMDLIEHIAGPNCTCTLGYSGWRITAEEMQERLQCQCLAPKQEGWQPEPGDEEFEIEAQHCWLTGISKQGTIEFEVEGLEPVRHGLGSTEIDNSSREGTSLDGDYALPIHPHCFVMYTRMSKEKLGKVDIDGLWRLRETAGNYQTRFMDFPRRCDVDEVSEQWHNCVPGTEYLASDPLHVSGLEDMLTSCEDEISTATDVVFEARVSASDGSDPFVQLSPELRHMLFPYLDRSDVANMRLASRGFGQLPQTYFHQLISFDMPWLWEVEFMKDKIMDWHALWRKLSAADGGSDVDDKERKRWHDTLAEKYAGLQEEVNRESLAYASVEWFKRWDTIHDEALAETEAIDEVGMWPARKTGELRGLRNRRRIWGDLEEIMRRIARLPPDEEA
ncbi:Uu.00g001020.m01.CDS01 [Anthostomella pinea]|uniref:Uu.00g001020.m01.CDS01 n=1 Tax=Anthostomella pinea TaxID=933095 RepID=A0AAI8YIL7_9PEZI|nr:Uu.00g001020.m01.CDS01 [Anthostomella pinea]